MEKLNRTYKILSLLSLLSLNLSSIFYVKWKSVTACVVFKDNVFLSFSLAGFFKDNRDNRDNLFLCEMEKANRLRCF